MYFATSARSRARSRPRVHSLRRAGQVLLQPRPRALQRGVDRRLGGLEQLGRVPRAPAEHVAQDQHGARARGARCWRATRNASSIVSRATTSASGSSVGGDQEVVRDRLQPGHLAVVGRRARALGERVQAGVGRDPVQPGAQRRPPGVGLAEAPGAQERLLREVLGLVERAEHPVAVDLQLAAVALGQGAEGRSRRSVPVRSCLCDGAVHENSSRCYHGARSCTPWTSRTWSSATRPAPRRSRASRCTSRRASSSACSAPTAPASRR